LWRFPQDPKALRDGLAPLTAPMRHLSQVGTIAPSPWLSLPSQFETADGDRRSIGPRGGRKSADDAGAAEAILGTITLYHAVANVGTAIAKLMCGASGIPVDSNFLSQPPFTLPVPPASLRGAGFQSARPVAHRQGVSQGKHPLLIELKPHLLVLLPSHTTSTAE
jgi:hypothetical protein